MPQFSHLDRCMIEAEQTLWIAVETLSMIEHSGAFRDDIGKFTRKLSGSQRQCETTTTSLKTKPTMNDLPTTLIEAVRYFTDLDVCNEYMKRIKWPNGTIVCPNCEAKGKRIGGEAALQAAIDALPENRRRLLDFDGAAKSLIGSLSR